MTQTVPILANKRKLSPLEATEQARKGRVVLAWGLEHQPRSRPRRCRLLEQNTVSRWQRREWKGGRSPPESCWKGGNRSFTIKAVYNVLPSPKYLSQWCGREAPSIWLTTVLSPTSSWRTPAFVWEDKNQARLSSSTPDIGGAQDWRLSLPAEGRPSINQTLYYGHISSGSRRKTRAQPQLSRQTVAVLLM